VAPAQVAEWAGHSVEVLLRTYVRCLDGQHDVAKRRIMEALDDPARDDGQLGATQAGDDKQDVEESVADHYQDDSNGDDDSLLLVTRNRTRSVTNGHGQDWKSSARRRQLREHGGLP